MQIWDALPIQEANEVDYISRHEGCMHACGHDTHMTMLLGAAKILSEHKDQIPGTVRLLFQTDEEGSRGAQRLCAEGAMDGVDAVSEPISEQLFPRTSRQEP